MFAEIVERVGRLEFYEQKQDNFQFAPIQRQRTPDDVTYTTASDLTRRGTVLFMRWAYESNPSNMGTWHDYPLPPPKLLNLFDSAWNELFSDWGALGPGNGHVKSDVCIRFVGNKSNADTWLFQRMPYAARTTGVDVGVGVLLNTDRDSPHLSEFFLRGPSSAWQRTLNALRHVEPVGLHVPFVLLGLSTVPVDDVEFIELVADDFDASAGSPLVERVIEVPPQYQQAMVGILSYFTTYLAVLAPDLAADSRVRIEQQNNKLKLVVEGNDGKRHEIEQAFDEYQQVVRGERSIESLSLSPFEAAELRSELRMAQLRIENQKDLLLAAGREVRSLRDLAMELAKRPPPVVQMTVSNSAMASASAEMRLHMSPVVAGTKSLIEVLKQDLESPVPEVDELRRIEAVLADAEGDHVSAKPALGKLRSILESAQEKGSKLNSALEKISGGIETAQSLARRYNKIAGWLALPQVPGVLTGED